MESKNELNLGDMAICTVTGVTGTVVTVSFSLGGEVNYLLQPRSLDGRNVPNPTWCRPEYLEPYKEGGSVSRECGEYAEGSRNVSPNTSSK